MRRRERHYACHHLLVIGNYKGKRSCRIDYSASRFDFLRFALKRPGVPRVKISIIFESGARIGPGKARLLESIRDTGSISAAARDMRMSYKRAWVLLDSMNQAFTKPLVAAAPGGAGGGGAMLTEFGAEVLERYRRIHGRADAEAAEDLAALARRARADPVPKV